MESRSVIQLQVGVSAGKDHVRPIHQELKWGKTSQAVKFHSEYT